MAQQNLKRLLGRGFSIAACVGLVVGLGILRTPGEIATVITDPGVYMALWIGGGLFVLLSVAVVAELFAMTPKSGGMYALVAHAYGPYPGFLIGWIDFVAGAASAALKSVVLVEYVALLMPGLGDLVTPGALVITTAFASLQLGGVRLGGSVHQAAATPTGTQYRPTLSGLGVSRDWLHLYGWLDRHGRVLGHQPARDRAIRTGADPGICPSLQVVEILEAFGSSYAHADSEAHRLTVVDRRTSAQQRENVCG